ncbi:hypothetical protein HMPREF3232_01017 [Fannyhessea vaginae]|nr:hypothetical protein HMPREF3232_01017 [Fannyhessea vaginae]
MGIKVNVHHFYPSIQCVKSCVSVKQGDRRLMDEYITWLTAHTNKNNRFACAV